MAGPRELWTHPLGHDQYFFASYATADRRQSYETEDLDFWLMLKCTSACANLLIKFTTNLTCLNFIKTSSTFNSVNPTNTGIINFKFEF